MKPYYSCEYGELWKGDCLEVLPYLSSCGVTVDMVCADPPYGTTQCKWDSVIPLDRMWACLKSLTKDNSAICLFGSEPFSSLLRCSNLKEFKYDWIWDKVKGTGFLNAKKQPMRNHEIISVFYTKQCLYNPQKTKGNAQRTSFRSKKLQTDVYGDMNKDYFYSSTERYPRSIQEFITETQNASLHPTQKPVALITYLIKTYTHVGDIVLDFTAGSGTTAVAAIGTGRHFVCVEKEEKYCEIAANRIEESLTLRRLAPPQHYKDGEVCI